MNVAKNASNYAGKINKSSVMDSVSTKNGGASSLFTESLMLPVLNNRLEKQSFGIT
jgi:hypothetical protein